MNTVENSRKLINTDLINEIYKKYCSKLSSDDSSMDDSVVIKSDSKYMVWSNKILMEGIHFDLTYVPFKHLGYKAVVVAISNIFAMNATPTQLSISMGLSAKINEDMLSDFYYGVSLACEKYKIGFNGGDITTSLTGFTIAVSAFGQSDHPIYRNTAKEGDLICVTGDLGAAYMGIQILEREKRLFQADRSFRPKLDGYDYVLQRQLKPEARMDIIEWMKQVSLVPTSMKSLSTGLASDLVMLCNGSNLGCNIYEHKLPIAEDTEKVANEINISPSMAAMNGGEDYELIFTIPLSEYQKVIGVETISIIGNTTPSSEGMYFITQNDEQVELQNYRII